MIRRLVQTDNEQCMQLLKQKSAENLFIIGDIENYGYNQPFQQLWGEFNENGALIAVLLHYKENFIPFAIDTFDAKGFADIISNTPTFSMLSGLKEYTTAIAAHLPTQPVQLKETFYAKCTKLNKKCDSKTLVQQATVEDVEEIVAFLQAIPEFRHSVYTVEKKRQDFQDGTSRCFYIKEGNEIASMASTSAETSAAAMIIGVATKSKHQKKGYATTCMITLCDTLLQEGKELCLFYDNPVAGAMYHEIGFVDIGKWMMYIYK